MLREELSQKSACLQEADRRRCAAEDAAARLDAQVQDMHAYAIAAEAARVEVSAESPPRDL